MTTIIVLTAVLFVIAVALLIYDLAFNARVTKRELDVEQMYKAFDEVLASFNASKLQKDDDGFVEVKATYCVSESDLIKYDSDEKLMKNVRQRLMFVIGNDIIHKFRPEVSEDGRKFTYKLRVKQ